MCLERPLVYGALASIQKRLGKDKFPLIEQNYYSSFRDLLFTPDFPVVVKVQLILERQRKSLPLRLINFTFQGRSLSRGLRQD